MFTNQDVKNKNRYEDTARYLRPGEDGRDTLTEELGRACVMFIEQLLFLLADFNHDFRTMFLDFVFNSKVHQTVIPNYGHKNE